MPAALTLRAFAFIPNQTLRLEIEVEVMALNCYSRATQIELDASHSTMSLILISAVRTASKKLVREIPGDEP